ncbi:AzlD domain-containing protein [Aquabacter spiritensis]|uniref:Branched-subunit amino acid transport protein AzlD n=1 Tax=Aquabacter spiritensis TaxID=933073 RepID=A0A4R3LXH5_9HYPH|nr:AzlD domain-containing protein [Aquabacter spiritensis]TCT03297.1 branched-subunit amino acid transport protein AzlD [Aquabacter spiritensis]
MIDFSSEWTAILIVILVGFLPSEIWRMLAVIAGRRMDEGSEAFLWVKAVATALLAAVVARLIFVPTGALVEVPLWLRLLCIVGGIAAFTAIRRSVLAGVVVGEAILVLGAWWLG